MLLPWMINKLQKEHKKQEQDEERPVLQIEEKPDERPRKPRDPDPRGIAKIDF